MNYLNNYLFSTSIIEIPAPRPILQKLVRQYINYTKPLPLRVAIGTYNINGGKHFRSIVYKDVSLSDWLLDAHKSEKTSGKERISKLSVFIGVICLYKLVLHINIYKSIQHQYVKI